MSHQSSDLTNEQVNELLSTEGSVLVPVATLRRLLREAETLGRIRAGSPRSHNVDCLGLALDLETASKKVQSQTALRAMEAAANGLRIISSS